MLIVWTHSSWLKMEGDKETLKQGPLYLEGQGINVDFKIWFIQTRPQQRILRFNQTNFVSFWYRRYYDNLIMSMLVIIVWSGIIEFEIYIIIILLSVKSFSQPTSVLQGLNDRVYYSKFWHCNKHL